MIEEIEEFENNFQLLLSHLPVELLAHIASFFSKRNLNQVSLVSKDMNRFFSRNRIAFMRSITKKRVDLILKDLTTFLVLGNTNKHALALRDDLNKDFLSLQKIFNRNQIQTLLLKRISLIKEKEATADYTKVRDEIVKPYISFFPEEESRLKEKLSLTKTISVINWDDLFENKEIRYEIYRQLINFFSKVSKYPPVTLENENHFILFSNINTWLQKVKGFYDKPHEYKLLKWLKAQSEELGEIELTEILKQTIEKNANPNQSYKYKSPKIIGAIVGMLFYIIMLWGLVFFTKGAEHPLFYPLTGFILAVICICIALGYGEHIYLNFRNNKEFNEIKSNFQFEFEDNTDDFEDENSTPMQIMKNF